MANFLEALIREIEKLYRCVTLKILHKRIGAYHRHENYSEKSHAGDIKSSLLGYIDNVVVTEKPPPKVKFSVDSIIPKFPVPNKYQYEKHQGCGPHVVHNKYAGDLSKYFKSREKAYELEPGIKYKLEHSVWDHINASIQCAHKGDNRNAKMHADIANSAFKEVAHYIPEDEYAEFSKKVTERMETLAAAH